MGKFAQDTQVPIEKTKVEIERIVVKYGAKGFVSAWQDGHATVQFKIRDRVIRFVIELPRQNERRFTHMRVNRWGDPLARKPDAAVKAWEQGCKAIWRALLLVIK